MTVRPYQLLCIVCSFGENSSGPKNPRLKEILQAIRANPNMPIALCCNMHDLFAYQNPGTRDDTPEGADYNKKRDMEILKRLDLVPGAILPARVILQRIFKMITSTYQVCAFDSLTSNAWQGCPKAPGKFYEKAHANGIQAIIPPRDAQEMAREKQTSLKELHHAEVIPVRPHLLVCAIAQYGRGVSPDSPDGSLPELTPHLLQLILENPDTQITLVPGADHMMCRSCPAAAGNNTCITGKFSTAGLYSELKDINILQAIGLTYGTTIKAKELYKLILEKIPNNTGVCALDSDIPDSSLWRDVCGTIPGNCNGYDKGRELFKKALKESCDSKK